MVRKILLGVFYFLVNTKSDFEVIYLESEVQNKILMRNAFEYYCNVVPSIDEKWNFLSVILKV